MTGRTKAALTLATAVCVTATGCGASLSNVPMPHPGVGKGGYQITAIFENALNLPAYAAVRLGGADVGQLHKMVARNYTAVTTLSILQGVQLPEGTTAELRSSTPLGDIFVAVKPPSPADPDAPLMKDGDTIPIERTSSAATVEGLLASAALLVNGGAVRNLTNVINGVGRATGDQGHAFGKLIDDTNLLLGKMTARSDQLETSLRDLSKLSDEINARNHIVTDLMVNAAPAVEQMSQQVNQLTDLVETAGATTEMLRAFPSIAGTDTSGRSAIKDMNTVAAQFNEVVLHPDARLEALNKLMPPIVKSMAGSAWSVKTAIDRLVLCRYADIGFKMDEGCRGLRWSNFNQILGTFKYAMFRFQERIVGRGPGVPQVPVLPAVEPGGPWEVVGPPPGPTAQGEFCSPQGVCHRGYRGPEPPYPGPIPSGPGAPPGPGAPAAGSAEAGR